MTPRSSWLLAVCLTASAGCAAKSSAAPEFVMGREGAIARARADSIRYPYTVADIEFMNGMIHHHAQAVTISRWASSHGADAEIQRLAARIINAQRDEITLMQSWLSDRNQTPPHVDSTGAIHPAAGGHDMAGHGGHGGHSGHGDASMPGMLTEAELNQLNTARSKDFDRLFLTFMIQHHRGAVIMVKKLFESHGAGQDETIFKFANDVEVDQSTEIRRMISMMIERGFMPPAPPA